MGTLMATALMQAGKTVMGKETLAVADLPQLLRAATEGVQARGKASLGDKTLLDALQPASEAFAAAISAGESLPIAAEAMVAAARDGRDRVTPLTSDYVSWALLAFRAAGHRHLQEPIDALRVPRCL